MRNLLHRAGYIEKMGTGINKMRRLVAEDGLPPIEFEFGTFFTAIFRRPARIEPIVFDERGGVFGGVNEKVAERLGKAIKALCVGLPSNSLNILQRRAMHRNAPHASQQRPPRPTRRCDTPFRYTPPTPLPHLRKIKQIASQKKLHVGCGVLRGVCT